jgi:RHS repeat-associated protein
MRSKKLFLTTTALTLTAALAAPLSAQTTLDAPPIRDTVDEYGIDIVSGEARVPSSVLSIGGAEGLTHSRYRVDNGWRHNFLITAEIQQGQSDAEINIGGIQRTFTLNSGVYESNQGTGETITPNFTTGVHTYTASDGTEILLKESYVANGEDYYGTADALGDEIISPNGVRTKLHYTNDDFEQEVLPGFFFTIYVVRLQSVTTNTSYQLHFEYTNNDPANTDDWYAISKVTAINTADEYCNPSSNSCTLTGDWPYLEYARSTSGTDTLETVTDVLGRQVRFRQNSAGQLTGIKRPSETTDGVTLTYHGGRVASITHQGSYTRNYAWGVTSNTISATSNDSLGRLRITVANTDLRVITLARVDNDVTNYIYDAEGRLDTIDPPGSSPVTEFEYDARGNITKTTVKPKPGSSEPDIVTTATYPTNCSNPVTCNLPTSVTDPLGNTTNFTYNSTHGGVTQVQLPADDDGHRPTTHFTYATRYARTKNSSGNLVNQANPVTKLIETETCRTATNCTGTVNARVTKLTYDNTISANLHPTRVSVEAGNGTLTASADATYTPLGLLATTDGPLSGTGDTTTYRYDDSGQLEGVIAPDPDGAGSLQQIARRYTYNLDGQVTLVESGHVAGTSESDWTGFTTRTKIATTYDEFGRVETRSQPHRTGTAQHSITQYSYDVAGRLDCVALRMNAPTISTTLPSNACTAMTAGTQGEDRITQRIYDASDRVREIWSGVGTSLSQKTAALSYNTDTTLNWVEDARGNRTEYGYDDFLRPVRTTYPSPTNANTANPTDYAEVTYDAAGNVLTLRTRRGETITYGYDNLNRLTSKMVPNRTGLATAHTRDTYYDYDLFGAMTAARFDNATSGPGVVMNYDSLGRLLSETQNTDGNTRTVSSQYDVAGRRTRVTHPDGAYWTYEYDTLGRLTRIRDDDASNLVTNVFRNWGSQQRRNRDASAPDELFYYDSAERLNRIFVNHPNSAYDVNQRYTNNRANQAMDKEVDNQLYVWDAQPSGGTDTDYSPDGLNRYVLVEGSTFTYDDNGNLTSDGTTTYTYDVENRLVSASGGNSVTLHYDPLGRLYQIDGGAQRWLYDGDAMIGAFNATGGIIDRHVHGISAGDDPLITYTGSSSARTDAEHLLVDRIGSIIGAFRNNGTALAINSYDEYGVPGGTTGNANLGRFRYTGQIWLPELGMYHYKARAYSPTLGRFMQTDPIGYGDGLNMYAYVGNDPTNGIDPFGLCKTKKVVTGSRIPQCVSDDGGGGTGVPGVQSSVPAGGGGGGGGSGPIITAEGFIIVTASRQYSGIGFAALPFSNVSFGRIGEPNIPTGNPIYPLLRRVLGPIIPEDTPPETVAATTCPAIDRAIDFLNVSGIAADGVSVTAAATGIGAPAAVPAGAYSRIASFGTVFLYGVKGDTNGVWGSVIGIVAGKAGGKLVDNALDKATGAGDAIGGTLSILSLQSECKSNGH